LVLVATLVASCGPELCFSQTGFVFRDVGDEACLFPAAAGIAGHGVGWGDIDGDGWADLYVGTFGGDPPYGSKPNQLFRNVQGRFTLDEQPALRIVGRANGAVFVDLDNDGDLDLYATNHAIDYPGQPHFQQPSTLFRNEGGGQFTDISASSGACPAGYAQRSVAAVDIDGDGLLDLLVGECFFQGGTSRSRLFRNLGNLAFADHTAVAGLPEQVTGFGVAAGDVNGDSWPDLFLAGRHLGNRLFINDGQGHVKEVPATHANFQWQFNDTADDTTCGVAMGDVNRDGLTDIVVGSHCDRPWWTGGVPIRLYMNRGTADGWPRFEDVTDRVGLTPLPMKSPHVEIQDFDNDGLPDVYTAIAKFAGGKTYPLIFRNQGLSEGLPRFFEDTLAVNDFPTEQDKQTADVGEFFARMEAEHKIVYTAPGPTCDYDRDGRLDMFMANWWVNSRSLLLRNETAAGNYLDVIVKDQPGVNRQGIGAVVRVYPAGKLGQPADLWCAKEIAVGYGYASGQEAIAHFGLGPQDRCDLEIILPHGKGRIERRDVAANQRLVVTP
jgi:enediyne biosynthesis protein E4